MKATLTFLTPSTKHAVEEITEELGLIDPLIFIRKAVEDKLREIKRAEFFGISERVAAGLRRRGSHPFDLIKTFKS